MEIYGFSWEIKCELMGGQNSVKCTGGEKQGITRRKKGKEVSKLRGKKLTFQGSFFAEKNLFCFFSSCQNKLTLQIN